MSEPRKPATDADKQARAWTTWVQSLFPAARAALAGTQLSPQDEDWDQWLTTLSAEARAAAQNSYRPPPETDEVETAQLGFVLFECKDGDWPSIKTYETVEALARQVGRLDGEDVVVMVVYGEVLPISVGPIRYIGLPGGSGGISVPSGGAGRCERVGPDVVDMLTHQDDGFLGPEQFRYTAARKPHPVAGRKKRRSGPDDEAGTVV